MANDTEWEVYHFNTSEQVSKMVANRIKLTGNTSNSQN